MLDVPRKYDNDKNEENRRETIKSLKSRKVIKVWDFLNNCCIDFGYRLGRILSSNLQN